MSLSFLNDYFPNLNPKQIHQFEMLDGLFRDWNSQINVISRKDIEFLYERHVLHSMAIAKYIQFKPGTKVLDVGTGGGFPGIPLAILFPQTKFTLIDSIGKKIKVVNEISNSLELNNCIGFHENARHYHHKVDFVVSRAVTNFRNFLDLVNDNISPKNKNSKPNGIIYLKGGDLTEELFDFKARITQIPISKYFGQDFFNEKTIIHYY